MTPTFPYITGFDPPPAGASLSFTGGGLIYVELTSTPVVVPVPEPTTGVLFGLGLIALGLPLRRS